ncbi:uncharacterized protein BYT42DRAFT_508324 [Radiomyces spectabilis]|uniref:uncharacterized protein n=1 Tax=Radiomyces spectabilis TaxID=64574 RepID=UPI00222102A9|nr:uncharacterized protein BYT42DRAFT_508324 [Radiomyces spectabilis]KAI8394291.1 hypothetical protein BYT42DRAFT_508324 [Radiomyces spectabilis]
MASGSSTSSKTPLHKGKDSQSFLSLSDFLWQTPLVYNCRLDETAKQTILTRCYESLWLGNDAIMQQYFFPSRDALQKAMTAQFHRHDGKEFNINKDPTSWHTNGIVAEKDLASQRGRPCGHVFRKGEPVYRCRNCGLDDTCVFCSTCFHATDHDGHDVLFSISPGSGGCCDCGDAEAWKVPLQCKVHSLDAAAAAHNAAENTGRVLIEPALVDGIRHTIASVLDFLLETFALAPDEVSLPSSTEDLLKENREQRRVLSRLGIPSQLPHTQPQQGMMMESEEYTAMDASIMDEEDVDMDKENSEAFSADAGDPQQGHSKESSTDEGDGDLYACIAWNDEAHAFSHVLESIMSATNCDFEKAKEIVDVIHVHGREIIATSTNIEELRKIAAPLAAINLGVTIRPARDTFREQICGLLVDWLKQLINGRTRFFPQVAGGDAIIRTILCEELCAEWELRLPMALLTTGPRTTQITADDVSDEEDLIKEDMTVTASNEDIEMFEPDVSSHAQQKFGSPESSSSSPVIYRNQCDIASIDWDPAAMVREFQHIREEEVNLGDMVLAMADGNKTAGKKAVTMPKESSRMGLTIQKEFEDKLRLDYFMLYDLKLWKEVRVSLRELYINSLITEPGFKKILGKRLARNYARLAESFLLKDREPENSIILFSVQLLTVPTVSDLLVNEYYFFGLICSTLAAFFLTDHLYLLLPSERARLPSRINCESRAFRTRRYFNAFHDLRYIMNVDMIKRVLAEDPLYLRQYLDLISLFQAMNAQLCQKNTHVEYESEIWVNAFNVTLQIAKCCRQFADCYGTLPVATFEERVATSKTLIRSVARVLKTIEEWGGDEDENMEAAMLRSSTTDPSVVVASEQNFHTVTLPDLPPFEVVQFSVHAEPVSFHHPLHWLLAGLLEHASILDEEVLHAAGWSHGLSPATFLVNEGDKPPSQRRLLAILDFPIRTIVFSSQIRAGVWVRNGYGIRNQAHHYRDISLRENTYDADIFLLQFGFIMVDPELLLVTLLDRFDLKSWFQGETTHEQYDTTQTVFMVEELLNLLIVSACERANATSMSIQEKIRREIIHNLCLGPTACSELVKRIPERLSEHPDFDRVLAEVASFRPPGGINDHGMYELKEEYHDHVDTYFWHYSRNNREEAENVFKARWKKANADKKEEDFFIIPKTSKISYGPFKYLGAFLHTRVFTQMMTYALWNVRMINNHKSDTILDQTLYLILLALLDENSDIAEQAKLQGKYTGGFYHHICKSHFSLSNGQHYQELTLFEILTIFRQADQYKEAHSQLDWIFDRLQTWGTDSTCHIVRTWVKCSGSAPNAMEGQTNELSEYEKKKKAAKERQQRIMAQFAQAQSQFMENNEGLYDEDEEEQVETGAEAGDSAAAVSGLTDEDGATQEDIQENEEMQTRFYTYPTGTCIVCQEDVNERSLPYGLLGFLQTSNVLRETPMDDKSVFRDIVDMGCNLDVDWPDKQMLPDDAPSLTGLPAQLHKTGLYASTCGHLMHIKCFEVYCTSIDARHSAQLTRNHPENRTRKEFMCPLCKSLGNTLLPVFWKGKKEVYPGVLVKANDASHHHFLESTVPEAIDRLKSAILSSRPAFNQRRRSSGTSKLKEAFNTWMKPSTLRPTATGQSMLIEDFMNRGSTGSSNTPSDAGSQSESSLQLPGTSPSNDRLGPFDSETLHGTAMANVTSIRKTYSRLFDVLSIIYQEICSDESRRELSTLSKNVDLLWGLLGYTIAGVEIAARGMARKEHLNPAECATGTMFDQIPPQTQILLRILSDTIMAYTNVMGMQDMGTSGGMTGNSSHVMTRVNLLALGRLGQIFVDAPLEDMAQFTSFGQDKIVFYENPPLLEDDPFMVLVELSLHLIPDMKLDVHSLMRTLLLAELSKTVIGLIQGTMVPLTPTAQPTAVPEEVEAANKFAFWIMEKLNISQENAFASFAKFGSQETFWALLKFYALPFLRRCMILMITRFGLIVTPSEDMSSGASSEVDRLLDALQLPRLDVLLQRTDDTERLVGGWCRQFVKESERRMQIQETVTEGLPIIALDLPTPLYLVALPRRLDRLFDESLQRVCQKCGTIPSDPALCLFCGTFVCAQSFCCAEEEDGECNLHTLECGGEVGIFLSVKRCVLILLHNGNGWFINAPYLDPHGEVDQGLRRGKPQYLSLKRYAETRKLWLQHNIPIYVARQIEANYDIGGWTTL